MKNVNALRLESLSMQGLVNSFIAQYNKNYAFVVLKDNKIISGWEIFMDACENGILEDAIQISSWELTDEQEDLLLEFNSYFDSEFLENTALGFIEDLNILNSYFDAFISSFADELNIRLIMIRV